MINGQKYSTLVLDTSAFIYGSDLRHLAGRLVVLPDFMDEIKDRATSERMEILRNLVDVKQPSREDIEFVIGFAKRTGDYHVMSMFDIRIVALTYALEKEANGGRVEHLNDRPKPILYVKKKAEWNKPLVGFYVPKRKTENPKDTVEGGDDEISAGSSERIDEIEEVTVDDSVKGTEDVDGEGEEEDQENDDDEVGWVNSSNIDELRQMMTNLNVEKDEPQDTQRAVACVTSDFAMQNVLLQIGLNVISPKEGLAVKCAKQWVLRCHACYKVTNEMERKFCPSCGNLNTLKRVSVSIDSNGQRVIHINARRPINIRGTRYSLPAPKGGKHHKAQILVEDQRLPQNKVTKFVIQEKRRVNSESILKDPDYINRNSPFALNDVYSRASQFKAMPETNLFLQMTRKRNPNVVGRSTGNRKKKNETRI